MKKWYYHENYHPFFAYRTGATLTASPEPRVARVASPLLKDNGWPLDGEFEIPVLPLALDADQARAFFAAGQPFAFLHFDGRWRGGTCTPAPLKPDWDQVSDCREFLRSKRKEVIVW